MSKRARPSIDNNGQSANIDQRQRRIPDKALECFWKLLLDKQFCDVTFIVGPSEEEIKAHKLFLIARSDVFLAQFRGDWGNINQIPLPQFEPRAFEGFLVFIYTDQVPISAGWMDLLPIGHYFMVKPLVRYCADEGVKAARLYADKTVQAFQMARLYDQKSMMAKIAEFMAKSFVPLASSMSFKETVDDDTLRYLLGLDHLRVKECDLFKIVLGVATVRASRSGGRTTVAAEMEKFLPLIRFPTMDATEFRAVVDASGILSVDTVINLYRYFAAKDAADKQAIASTWAYNDVRRRARDFVRFNTVTRHKVEITLPMYGKPNDFVSFTMNVTDVSTKTRDGVERMLSTDTKGIAITGIGIQCPVVIHAGTEVMDTVSCAIEIKHAHSPASNVSVNGNVTPNDWTEVSIIPPLIFPPGSAEVLSITAEFDFGPLGENKSPKEVIRLQHLHSFQQCKLMEAELCNKKVTVSDLEGKGYDSINCYSKLIRGIRIQAM